MKMSNPSLSRRVKKENGRKRRKSGSSQRGRTERFVSSTRLEVGESFKTHRTRRAQTVLLPHEALAEWILVIPGLMGEASDPKTGRSDPPEGLG